MQPILQSNLHPNSQLGLKASQSCATSAHTLSASHPLPPPPSLVQRLPQLHMGPSRQAFVFCMCCILFVLSVTFLIVASDLEERAELLERLAGPGQEALLRVHSRRFLLLRQGGAGQR